MQGDTSARATRHAYIKDTLTLIRLCAQAHTQHTSQPYEHMRIARD